MQNRLPFHVRNHKVQAVEKY